MKLREIVRYELRYQARRIPTWLYGVLLLGLVFQIAAEGYVGKARNGGYAFNAPLLIMELTLLGSVMGLLISAALAGDAAARDVQTGMHPLVYTAPVSKAQYLGGRFLAAFVLDALLLLAIPVALLLATYRTGLEPELLAPFRAAAYAQAYLLVALPNAFVATALSFACAALARRATTAYLGIVLLFAGTILCWQFVAMRWNHWDLAKLLDPLGFTMVAELTRTWSPAEKRTRLIGLGGGLLANRLLWLGLSGGLLALTHARFRFAHEAPGARRGRRAHGETAATAVPDAPLDAPLDAPIVVPPLRRTFGVATHARQALAVARRSFREVVTSWGGLGIVALPTIFALTGGGVMQHLGVPLVPTTEYVTKFMVGSGELLWLIVPLLTLFYAGELVWGDRDARLSDIADVAPVPDWVPFAGKLLGLGLVLAVLQGLMMAAAMLLQASLGYHAFEPGVYARILFGLQLPDYLLFALLALVVHVLVDHKYVGHVVAAIAYAFTALAAPIGVEHHLLVFGSDPGWMYSDMRGFDPFVGPVVWLKLYWAAWALVLAVAATLLWVRGREAGVTGRLALARRRLTHRALGAAATGVGLVLGLGGFVFYNTNVLHDYRDAPDAVERRLAYERRYGRYDNVPQPQITRTSLRVELHPSRRAAEIAGTYRLVNRAPVPIDSIHVATARDVATEPVTFDRAATRVLADDTLGHHIYALATPLTPGDSVLLRFTVRYAARGFANDGIDASVVRNGSYVAPYAWLPRIGYQASRALTNAADRRAHGLAPHPYYRPLGDTAARYDVEPRIAFEAIVGTDAGQTAVAPGRLRRTWTERGRRYFDYATDAPIRNEFALYSARYAVREARWTPTSAPGSPVTIQIVHHPGHARNVDRMIASVRASLDYYGARFGPYPYGTIRLVEHPGDAMSLHASPIDISYQESFDLLDPAHDPRGVDFPFAIVAHEVAHQWWGNQVTPARVEGGGVLTESLAWYSAMGVVEHTYGPERLRRVMEVLRESYLTPHARAAPPLLRADDWLLLYRKGPFAMYTLREYLGEARVNGALRRLVERYGAGTAPLPTSLDLYRELQAITPDSLRPLLADVFETNTYWSLAATRADARRDATGAWQVTLDVKARKEVVDSAGVAREVPMNDLVEIGVFGAATDGGLGAPLYLRLHRVRSGAQRITVTVPTMPARAGVDPRGLLIDAKIEDNTKEVTGVGAPMR